VLLPAPVPALPPAVVKPPASELRPPLLSRWKERSDDRGASSRAPDPPEGERGVDLSLAEFRRLRRSVAACSSAMLGMRSEDPSLAAGVLYPLREAGPVPAVLPAPAPVLPPAPVNEKRRDPLSPPAEGLRQAPAPFPEPRVSAEDATAATRLPRAEVDMLRRGGARLGVPVLLPPDADVPPAKRFLPAVLSLKLLRRAGAVSLVITGEAGAAARWLFCVPVATPIWLPGPG
jgi:hypothetical protein